MNKVLAAVVLGLSALMVVQSPVQAQTVPQSGIVVIANGWSPADVGTAAPLAGRLDAVMLYASRNTIGGPAVVALQRLRPSRVVLIGGRAALDDGVGAQVRSILPGVAVQRLSGIDRADTAARAALVAPMVPAGRPVVITNGWSPPDVGVAAPLADVLGGSVLFAHENALGDSTVSTLRKLQPSRVVVVGGTAALDSGTEAELGIVVPGVPIQRLAGVDRTDTAVRAAELARVATGSSVVVVNGWSSPDVGIAAPLAAAIDGTVLFSHGSSLGKHTVSALQRLLPNQVTLVGDTDAVLDEIQAEIAELVPSTNVQRISGRERTETAARAALYAAGKNLEDRSAQKVELSIGKVARFGGFLGSGQGTCRIPSIGILDGPLKHCYWLDIRLTNFESATEYAVACIYRENKLTERDRVIWKTATVSDRRSLSSLCHFGIANATVYVEVNGVTSNELVWSCDARTLYQTCQITSSSPPSTVDDARE